MKIRVSAKAGALRLLYIYCVLINLAVAVGAVNLWETFEIGLNTEKIVQKFLEIHCGQIVDDVERINPSTLLLITLCELLRIC